MRRREVRAAPGVGDLLGMVRAPILPAEGSRGEGRGGGGADGRVHREACGGGGGGVRAKRKEAEDPALGARGIRKFKDPVRSSLASGSLWRTCSRLCHSPQYLSSPCSFLLAVVREVQFGRIFPLHQLV